MPIALAFISMPGGGEWVIIGIIGLLLFGKRLPEVGNSLGKTIVEFKKGLRGIQDEIEQASHEASSSGSSTSSHERVALGEPSYSVPATPEPAQAHQEPAPYEPAVAEKPAAEAASGPAGAAAVPAQPETH